MQTIDCDVHVAPETFDALFPYLSDYWRQYITEAGVRLNGVAFAYQGLVCWKKRLGDAITAHAITNFLLALWVVGRGAWKFW